MIKKTLIYAALFAVLVGCGSSRDTDNGPDNSAGSAVISGEALVGETLTASATDADGVQSGTATYQWTRSGDLIPGAASSTYTLTPEDDGEEISVIIRYTDELGFRETSVSGSTFEIAGAFTLGATFIHGLVDGATCNIYAVDASGAASSAAAATGTTSSGVVDFGALVPIDGTGLIECTGGTYTDEATGLMLDAPDTRAIVLVDGDAGFTVSPLTEIAVQRAEAEGDLNTAISTHNSLVAAVFGVAGNITEIVPTDISTTPISDDVPGAYATALALISQLDANDVGSSTAEIIANLTTDLVDNLLSEDSINDIGAARTDLASSPFASNLNDTVLLAVEAALANTPEPATFEGLSATIPNDADTALEGTVTIIDVNPGEAFAAVQTDTATTYGTFSIAADGVWSYTVDTTNATVSGLDVGTSVNDTIAIASVDGTSANLVIRIAALTNVVRITDPGGDTGEIRFNLDEPLLVGKLTFSFLKEEALGSDGNVKDAYVALYGSEDSNRETLIDLRIQGDQFESDDITPIAPRFFARNTDHVSYPGDIVTYPFTEDQWYDVEITWNVDAVGQEVTVIIDGVVVNGGPFQTAAIVGDDCGGASGYRANCLTDGVENIQFRFGDNDRTIPFGSYFVDDIVVYDNEAGTGTPVFQDDFENSTLGTADTLYREEATVEVITYDRATADEPVPAQFLDLTASIAADDADLLTGAVSVFDPNLGENMVVGQTNTATAYGTFSIAPSGAWEYTLNTGHPIIAALGSGESVVDTIAITSIDGTASNIEITIRAPVVVPTGLQAAVIRDTDGGDTGELRYDITAQLSGRLEVTYDRTVTGPDAFIALLNSSGSTSSARSIIDIRVKDDAFEFRDQSFAIAAGVAPTPGTLQTVVITWTAPDALTPPTVTVEVDGVNVVNGGGSFISGVGALGGVERVQFRFGSGSNVSDSGDTFSIERFEVFSDTAGTTSVFDDDFSGYTVGNSLDPNATAVDPLDPDPTIEPGTPYNSSSSEVVVESLDEADPIAAVIRDTDGGDTGELRYDISAQLSGRLEVTYDRTVTGPDAFIALLNSSGSTSSARSIIDIRVKDDAFEFRDQSFAIAAGVAPTPGTLQTVVITWTAPDALTPPTVTVEVDGVNVVDGGGSFISGVGALGGVERVQFRFGSGSNVSDAADTFIIERFEVFSDTAGTTSVFADDFTGYILGNSLDPNATAVDPLDPDPTIEPGTPYNSSSSEVVVESLAAPPVAAAIRDTDGGDTGELRYDITAQLSGRLEVTYDRTVTGPDAFIALLNSSGSTSSARSIIDIRVKVDAFEFRDQSFTVAAGVAPTPGTLQTVVITWTAPDALTPPTVTVEVDGVNVVDGGGSFASGAGALGGVERVQFRFGSGSNVSDSTDIFYIESLEVFSDTAGTTSVFDDDFSGYTLGNSLDPNATAVDPLDPDPTIEPSTPYNSSSSEVTVEEVQ